MFSLLFLACLPLALSQYFILFHVSVQSGYGFTCLIAGQKAQLSCLMAERQLSFRRVLL